MSGSPLTAAGNLSAVQTQPSATANTPESEAKTPENQESSWTHVKLFHKVSNAVGSKTHKFVGWVVAALTSIVTTIPALAYDTGVAIKKSLWDRKVSKPEAPVQNQVSAKGAQTTEAKNQPTVEQLRKDHSELDNLMKAREASAEEMQNKANELEATKQQLHAMLAQKHQGLINLRAHFQAEQAKNKGYCDQWALHFDQHTNALKNDIAAQTQDGQRKDLQIAGLKHYITQLNQKHADKLKTLAASAVDVMNERDILKRNLSDQDKKFVELQDDYKAILRISARKVVDLLEREKRLEAAAKEVGSNDVDPADRPGRGFGCSNDYFAQPDRVTVIDVDSQGRQSPRRPTTWV